MALYDEYNNYRYHSDLYSGGALPQAPHPLPYPLPKIPKFTGVNGVGVRELPYIPDIPHPSQGHSDLYWKQLINKIAQKRVPSPVYDPSAEWLQLQAAWQRRQSQWEQDDDLSEQERAPPTPPPPVPSYSSREEPRPTGPRSRMSDYTTASEYGSFYKKQDGDNRQHYRVTSGARLPPI